MKSQDIKRDIQLRQNRGMDSAPGIGKVTRLRSLEAPVGRRYQRRQRPMNPSRVKAIFATSILLGLGTCVIMVVAVSFWLKPMLARKGAGKEKAQEKIVRIASQYPSPSREQAIDIVKRALSTRNVDAVQGFFRLGDSTPLEVLNYLVEAEQKDGPAERFDWLSSLDNDGILMEGVLVVFERKEKKRERLAILTPDAGGSWKLDFGAYARLVDPPWPELTGKSEGGTVRVFVSQDFYYNGPFRDEKQWICYGLSSPDTDMVLQGYCKVGSPVAESMRRMFSQGNLRSRATLEIRRVEDAESRQFEITRLIASDWVIPDPDSNG
jgi:hypothetical protein